MQDTAACAAAVQWQAQGGHTLQHEAAAACCCLVPAHLRGRKSSISSTALLNIIPEALAKLNIIHCFAEHTK